MALKREEYNAAYFGDVPARKDKHPAGYYPSYRRSSANTFGENFRNLAQYIHDKINLHGKSVLELGCAMGYLVEDMVDFGAEVVGVDWSHYAVKVRPANAVKKNLVEMDASEYLDSTDRRYDLIVSRYFLETFSAQDIPSVIRKMNKRADLQIHVFSKKPNENYYLSRDLNWWANHGFVAGTELILWSNKTVLQTVEVI